MSESSPTLPADAGDQPYCWLTTTGRRSGRARTVELWFALEGTTIYMLAGGRDSADWVRNVQVQPRVRLRLGSTDFEAIARLDVEGSEAEPHVRRLLAAKYQGWQGGRPLTRWAREALPVAFDIVAPAAPDSAAGGIAGRG